MAVLLAAAAASALPVAGAAQADAALLAELVSRADTMELHRSRAWHASMQYERTLFGNVRSAVASPWYFLAEDGPRNPRAELHATLAAFVRGDTLDIREEPVACAYASRWTILDRALDFAAAGLEEPHCERREEWLAALNPESAHLVFPSAYLNSPASMFGHTLLRIDGTKGSDDAPLLSYAVNFAAETEETNGLVFAVKGLTGGYTGSFSVLPYYEKVREYSRIENRDLWEYPLQISRDELDLVMRHLWQMRGVEFDYYFFTKNCSFQLLALLEVALPEHDLRGGMHWWAIPTDTMRSADRHGLLGPPRFRPAMATTMTARAEQIGAEDTARAVAVGRGQLAPDALDADDAQANARVLDLAHDWIYFHGASKAARRDEALARARAILGARAATGARSGFDTAPTPQHTPKSGHNTATVAVGGVADQGGSGVSLRLRPAYHDLLDPVPGYGEGSQLSFGDAHLLWNAERDRLQVVQFDAVNIVSLAPRSQMFRPISWRVAAGARRLAGLDSRLGGYVAGGPGLSVRRGTLGAHLFATAALDGNSGLDKDYAFGMGGIAGLLWQPATRYSALLELDSRNRVFGDDFDRQEARLGMQLHFARQWGLRAEGYVAKLPGHTQRGARLSLVRYVGPRFAAPPQR